LGEFFDCEDTVQNVLAEEPGPRGRQRVLSAPQPRDLAPLRAKISLKKGLTEIFGGLGARLGVPVAYGLPVGHGARNAPLPLGAKYRLTPKGELELVDWGWLGGRTPRGSLLG